MNIGIISPRVLFRKGLRALLESVRDFQVTLETGRPADAFKLPEFARTKVLLIDALNLVEGFEASAQIQQHSPDTMTLLLTDHTDAELELRAFKAGCQGSISWESRPELLEKALRVVSQGEVWISLQASSQLVNKLVRRASQDDSEIEELTKREWEILVLVAAGNRNKEIASQLCVSENTVKTHLYAIYRKLHVSTRMGAALFFFQHANRRVGLADSLPAVSPADKTVPNVARRKPKLPAAP
jgi:two-component system response regulator DegU